MSKAMKLACLGLAGVFATLACVVAGLAPYPAAAVMAGTGVAAVGVNRSLTGDCWGSCLPGGGMCDRDSGMCVPRPCGGECRFDEVCENNKCVFRRREQPAPASDVDGSSPPEDDDHRIQ